MPTIFGGMGVSPVHYSEENAGETPTPPEHSQPLKRTLRNPLDFKQSNRAAAGGDTLFMECEVPATGGDPGWKVISGLAAGLTEDDTAIWSNVRSPKRFQKIPLFAFVENVGPEDQVELFT